MESRRQKKISKEILKEITDIFQKRGLSVFDNAMVTVTNVHITPDLLIARIYLSIFNVKDKEGLLKRISDHNGEIRYELGNRMRHQLRRIPELEFYLDESLDQAYRMEQIFKDLKDDESDQHKGNDNE
jgi:ribosome-binding factor A